MQTLLYIRFCLLINITNFDSHLGCLGVFECQHFTLFYMVKYHLEYELDDTMLAYLQFRHGNGNVTEDNSARFGVITVLGH
jgi:hypothetical protein